MQSKYLRSLNDGQRKELEKKLNSKQKEKCYICEEIIELGLQPVDIDHIKPLIAGGKDSENNFALTHPSCNRAKRDTNLEVAKLIQSFKKIEKKSIESKKTLPDLSDILDLYKGSKFNFKFNIEGNKIKYSFTDIGDNAVYESFIYLDKLSKIESFFIEAPIEYIFHDELGLNPRKLSENVIKLIKEFYKKNPQLHLGLARLKTDDQSKLFIFDGQHKSAAQIILGVRKLLLRVFIDPNIETLAQTNERAGTTLRQIAFDKSVQRQLGATILSWKIERFQKDKGLSSDDYSFSETDLVSHFKGETREVKKFTIDYIRRKIIEDPKNKLVDYISFGGKKKRNPISYTSIERTFYSLFIYGGLLDTKPIFFNDQRINERTQIVNLMNIIQEEILQGYEFEKGIGKIEEKIRKIRAGKISEVILDAHLKSYRLVKEEILMNWLRLVKQVIQMYFSNLGRVIDEKKLFQEYFDDILWQNIRNLLKNLYDLPIWTDRERTHIFSKREYGYWQEIFRNGKSLDGIQVLNEGLNIIEMIKK